MTKPMMVFLAFLLYVFVYSGFIEPNTLEVVRYKIADEKMRGIRIAFLTDFHLKRHDYKRLDKIVKTTIKEKPDVVILGGDYVTRSENNSIKMNIFAQKMQLIDAKKYAVLGEYDWYHDAEKTKEILEANNIRVLDDTSSRVVIKRRYFDIIGLSDYQTKNSNLTRAFHGTILPRIVVTHNPDIYYNIMDNANLILAGHTHGGQFVIPLTPPLFVPSKYGSKFAYGEIKETKNRMIISKGLGIARFPLRLKCKPEIVIIDFN